MTGLRNRPNRPIPDLTGEAERAEVVQSCDTNLNLSDLTVDVPRHVALAQDFDALHFGHVADSWVCCRSRDIASLAPPMRDVRGKRRLTKGEHAEIRHLPVETNQKKQALDEPSRRSQRHPEKDLHRQDGPTRQRRRRSVVPTLADKLRIQWLQ